MDVRVTLSILTGILCLHRPVHSGYDAFFPPTHSVNYIQTSTSGTVRTFPNRTDIPTQEYGYFFSEFNFNIDSRLLTGAADTLYLFDLDLNVQSSYTWEPSPSISSSCRQNNDNSSYTCRNHIRTYKQLPSNSSQLLVCGTQGDTTPQCRIVEFTADGDIGGGYSAVPASNGLLSYFPEYTSFGEFISTESSDRFFSAALGSIDRDYRVAFMNVSLSDTSDPDTLQTSELFRTPINDRWLKFPVTFVDYFRADYAPISPATQADQYQFYFVFLRESLTNADVIYSRVARICRNDPGITTMGLGNHFTTFMKARIFCEREVPPGRQFAGSVDYNYNEIRSMVFNRKGRYAQPTDWVELMYGAFASPSIGPIGTAICVYRADNSRERGETGFNRGIFDIFREDLQDAQGNEFESTFVECSAEGRSSDNSQLIQVIQDVSQIGENPLLVLDGLLVTQMAVDQVCVVRSDGSGCTNQDILFMGTDTGKILKVIFVGSAVLNLTPVIAEEITLDDDNTVNRLSVKTISSSSKYIYASTFSRIYRLPLERCDRLNSPNNVTNSCRSCIASQDPYCVWNTNTLSCESNPLTADNDTINTNTNGYLQNVHTGTIPPECTFPEIGFALGVDSVNESETSYMVTITTSVAGAASSGLVEIYTLTGEGNATAGEDYRAVAGDIINFGPGSFTAVYSVVLQPDSVFEGGNEWFTVGLRATGAGGVVISQTELTLSIIEDDVVRMRLMADSLMAVERDCFVNVTIEKEGESTVDSVVLVSTAQSGSALVGEDYIQVEQEVSFSPTETRKTVTIPLINNDIQEQGRWFLAELDLPVEQVGVVLETMLPTTNITILDDDYVVIDFLESEFTVNEGDGTVTVTLVKNGQTVLDYEIEIVLLPGTAGTSDFDSTTRRVTFTAEESRNDVQTAIMDDSILEDQESFTIELRTPSGTVQEGLLANSSATVAITDNESGSVSFGSSEYSALEGAGSVAVTVELSVATEIDVVVELVTSAATASSEDFTMESVSLTYTAGGATSLPVEIQLIDDNVLELTEYFTAQLISTSQRVTVGLARANITIMDDDVITVGFSASAYTVSEGDRLVTVEISAVGSAEIPLTFFVTTSAESAVSGGDYEGFTMMSVNVVVPTTTVNVRLVDDDAVEVPEQFQVSLLASDSLPLARVSISRNVTSVNIIDDDVVMIDFLESEFTVNEGEGAVIVTLVKSGQTAMNVDVEMMLVPVTAGTSDFDSTTRRVTFTAEESRKDIQIAVMDDSILEDQESFTIELRTPSGTAQEGLLANSSATVAITDNESGSVSFSSSEYSALEGAGSVAVTVELSVATEIDVVVELVTSAATASNEDFNPVSVSVTFTAGGASSLPVEITLVDDDRLEMPEYFSLQLISTCQRITVGQARANVTIMDDDVVTVGFGAAQYSANENDCIVSMEIRLFGFTEIPLTFLLSTSNKSAVSGEDYEGFTMIPVRILTPVTTVNVKVINDDRVEEELEQFQVSLRDVDDLPTVGVNLNQTNTSISVLDDDVVQFGFESVLYSAAEGESQGVEVVVVKYGSSALNLSVGLSTADGTAMSAQDYTRVDNQELAFSPMERSKSVRIGLINDNVLEGDEQFSVSLGQLDPKARIIEALNFTTIVITDDDSPTLTTTTSSPGNVNEGTDGMTVSLPGPAVGPLRERCIYDSFTTSAVVLAVLLAIIVALSILFVISLIVLAKKVCNERKLKKYHYNQSDIPLTANGKRGTTPDRLPLDNFTIPNVTYCDNSQANTPVTPRPLEKDTAELWNGNNNNRNVEPPSHYYVANEEALEQSSSSSEDLTMSEL